jgi:hypothetical protein
MFQEEDDMRGTLKNDREKKSRMPETLEDQITSLEKYQKRYQLLLEAMQNEYFDEHDTQLVQKRLADIDSSLEAARTKLQQRDYIYETSVKKLMAILDRRQQILESVDEKTGLFAVDDELLANLAERQRLLTAKLKLAMDELAELPS